MRKFFIVLALVSFAVPAFAGPGASTQSLTFEEIKAACETPSKFHNQVAPSNIQISCRDLQLKWLPDTERTVSLDTARTVSASLTSDKYTTATSTADVATAPQVVTCAKYKQVAEAVETVRTISCADISAFNGSAVDFCASAASTIRASNPEAVNSQPTGKTVSLCGKNGDSGSPNSGEAMEKRDQRSQH